MLPKTEFDYWRITLNDDADKMNIAVEAMKTRTLTKGETEETIAAMTETILDIRRMTTAFWNANLFSND